MFIYLLGVVLSSSQLQPATPQFRSPIVPKVQIPLNLTAPKLEPPKGYKPVQVPDYVADTYMKFASTETAHDYQIFGIENRVSVLEHVREGDRKDIDSLNTTRSSAIIYFTIATTLITLVWGGLAAIFGFFLRSYLVPRFRVLWAAVGVRAEEVRYSPGIGIAINADEDARTPSHDKSQE